MPGPSSRTPQALYLVVSTGIADRDIIGSMTRLLEQAFSTVAALPDARQDELARVMLQLAGVDQPPIRLTPEEEADLAEAEAEIERGELATTEEVRAMWEKRGP